MVAVTQVAVLVGRPAVRLQTLEVANGIAYIEVIGLLRSAHTFRCPVLINIFEITEQEHPLAGAAAKIAIEFHALVARIFAEVLNRHPQLIGI